jgi:hypothetical protein
MLKMKNILIVLFLFSQFPIWSQCHVSPSIDIWGDEPVYITLCSGIPFSFNATIQHSEGQTVNYQWYLINSCGPINTLPYNSAYQLNSSTNNGITTTNFLIDNIYSCNSNQIEIQNFFCIVSFESGECNNLTAGYFTVEFRPEPLPLYNLPQSLTICSGDNINLNLSSTASYNSIDNNQVTGESNGSTTNYLNDVLVNNSDTVQTVVYYLNAVVDYGNGPSCFSYQQTITINVLPEPTISGNANICLNSSTQLTGNGTPSNTNPWQSSNTSVAVISNNGLVNTNSSGSTNITYTNAEGCSTELPITINNNPAPNFYLFYQGSSQCWDTLSIYTYTTGGTFTTSELGFGINIHQNTSPNNEIIGGTTLTYIEFYDFYGPWNQYYTFNYVLNGCTFTDSIFVGSVIGPFPNSITSQPTSQTISCGSNPNPFSISATGLNTYQWFSSTDGLTFTTITNATSNSFIPPNSQIGTIYYFCQMSQNYPDCNSQNSINSDTVTLNILQSTTITSQPVVTQNVCQNSTASPLIITADNPNVNYQWYSNTINLNAGGASILGATSNSFTPSTPNAGTFFYYCIIGGCNDLTSNVAEVFVNPIPTLNVSDTTICGGLSVQLTGNGTPSSGTYLWSGSGLSSPTNQQSQITVSPTTTTTYSISYTQNGCTINETVVVLVNPLPAINAGFDQSICEGESVTLNATGSNIIFWSNGLNNGDSFITSNDTTLIASAIENNCSNSDTLTITVNPQTSSSINETSIDSYAWNVTGQTYVESGIYVGVITNQFGCDSTITLNLTISSSSLSQISNTEKLTLFPNPNNGLFEILVGSELLNSNYTIFSSDGREIFNGKMTKQKETIVLPSTIEGGIYSLRIKNEVIRVAIVR